MGFDTIIVAFFVIGTIVFVACTVTMGANNLVKTSYEGFTASSQTTMDRLHTNIKLENPMVDEDDYVHLTIENTGDTKLSDFDLWDVIVVSNKQTSSQASYFKKNNGLNNGFSLTFTRNFINPGILDPHEIIDLKLLPEPEFDSGNSLYITVITENGIASSTNYTVS